MRLTTIPDDALWPGSERHVLMPPGGTLDSEVAPAEMLVDEVTVDGVSAPRFLARFVLEDGDLEKLREGGTVWLSLYGMVVPFDINVLDKDGQQ